MCADTHPNRRGEETPGSGKRECTKQTGGPLASETPLRRWLKWHRNPVVELGVRPPLAPRLSGFKALSWIHWGAITLSAGLTLLGYAYAKHIADDRAATLFERQAGHVVALVIERMQKYEDALWSGVSAISALGGTVNHTEWRAFASSLQIDRKYTGTLGLGVVHWVPSENLEAYVAARRLERPTFTVHPRVVGTEHFPISYIEPEANSAVAIGLDLAHEDNRLEAIHLARDTGQAQITAPIILAADPTRTPGFLFFAPYYGMPSAVTLEQRRTTLDGLVYAPILVQRLMHGTLERAERQVGVRILDGDTVLYDENRTSEENFDPDARFTTEIQAAMYGRTWRFEVRSDRQFLAANDREPLTILVGGTLIDGLLLLLFLGMVKSTRTASNYADAVTVELRERQTELERTNDALREQAEALETAKREAEQSRDAAERATAAKSTFLATMSHELRTPMNGVIATAELLVDASESERPQLTETIIRSGQTLLVLINDILDFSKLEAGKVQLDPQPTDLRRVLDELLRLLEPQCEANGVSTSCSVDQDVPRWVMVDAVRLRQILLNLCSNAVKFSGGGSVRVTCHLMGREDRDCHLNFSVEDTGIGIADCSMLFQEFTQADATTTRHYGGTGLGLAICKRLVERLGGTIGVSSVPGSGSHFHFQLRLPECEPPTEQLDSTPVGGGTPTPGSALVVDDNLVNRMVAQKLLERMGWRVTLACSGLEALQLAASTDFDLIFMDCQMPGMDGYQATTQLISRHARLPPVIALTANVTPADRERCLQVGMRDFLAKPVRSNELRMVVSKWAPERS